MGRFGEHKYFFPIDEELAKTVGCYWLTVGIGDDDQVERLVKAKYPFCQLFGVEPGSQVAHFSKYGTVIPFGLGTKPGNASLNVRGVGMRTVPVLTLNNITERFMDSTKLIHLATMDTEGFEYLLVESLCNDDKESLLNNTDIGQETDSQAADIIHFCQIDIELHGIALRSQVVKDPNWTFQRFWQRLLKNSAYLPVMAERFLGIHHKVSVINIENEECQNMFHFKSHF